MADICYTATGTISVPDIQILKLEPGWKTEPLRGYGYIVAVLNPEGKCLGYAVNPRPIL